MSEKKIHEMTIEEVLRPLTDEELANVKPLSDEEIDELLTRFRDAGMNHFVYPTWSWPFRPRF